MKEKYDDVSINDIRSFGSEEERKLEFPLQGWIGRYLRGLDITATVDGTLFVHGGVVVGTHGEDITRLNEVSRLYLESDDIRELRERIFYKKEFEGPL